MISSNLIKSDNEAMIGIGKFDIYERGLENESTESKITQFGFDFLEKSLNEQRRFFQKCKEQKTKNKD